MSIRIPSSVSSFYDSASRVERAARAQEILTPKSGADPDLASRGYEQSEQREQRGLQRTQVSPENSYQRTMLSDPGFAFDRMAGKLMDKLPQIFADMKAVPDMGTGAEVAAVQAQAPAAKVVISEESVANQAAEKQAQLQDISLGL